MDTSDFEALLNNTIIPSKESAAEKERRIAPLQIYIANNTPKHLYKYRSCCDNHISAFYKDQIWASTADTMNDGFDARTFFDKNASIQLYKEQTAIDKVKAFIDLLRDNDEYRKEISKIPGGSEALQLLHLPDDIIEQGIIDSKRKVQQLMLEIIDTLNIVTQQSFKFCCFSENVKSAYMWGQYANNESGFCLQYDFTDGNIVYPSTIDEIINTFIYPVIYKDQRYSVPIEYIEYLFQYRLYYMIILNSGYFSCVSDIHRFLNSYLACPDITVGTKIALNKSIEWKFEQEWRLFCNSVNGNHHSEEKHLCITKKPTGLYLGRRITEVNEKILVMLANEKNIPVFKMSLDDNSPSFELNYHKLN